MAKASSPAAGESPVAQRNKKYLVFKKNYGHENEQIPFTQPQPRPKEFLSVLSLEVWLDNMSMEDSNTEGIVYI